MSNLVNDIPIGVACPIKINAIVEVEKDSNSKYEYVEDLNIFKLSRCLYSSMRYTCSYGFIPQTFALDNDPLDILIYNNVPLRTSTLVEVKPIGCLDMDDTGEKDFKVVAVPSTHVKDYKSLKDLMSYAKNNPGKLTFSGSGTYSANHLLTISLNKKAKVKTTYVPFKGTGAAVQALLGKQVVAEAGYSTVAAKQGSKVRMLAVASEKRLPAFPDVPTFKELGYNIVSGAYRGYALPKSASKATVKEWSDRIMKINSDPAFIKQMEDNAFVVVNIGHNKIKKFMKDQQKANEAIAKELGLIK